MLDYDLLLDSLKRLNASELCEVEAYALTSVGNLDAGPFDEKTVATALIRLSGVQRDVLLNYLREPYLPAPALCLGA